MFGGVRNRLAMSALFIATVCTDDHCDQSIESNEQQHQTTVFLRTSGTIRILKKNCHPGSAKVIYLDYFGGLSFCRDP